MFRRELNKVLKKCEAVRKKNYEQGKEPNFDSDDYSFLSACLDGGLKSIFRWHNARVIAENYDRILPFICHRNNSFNSYVVSRVFNQPAFFEKFKEGIKKYPYKGEPFAKMINGLLDNPYKPKKGDYATFKKAFDLEVIKTIVSLNLYGDESMCSKFASRLDEEAQKSFIIEMTKYHRNLPFDGIDYKENNNQFIIDNLPFFIENSLNLHSLYASLKGHPEEQAMIAKYMDENEDKALASVLVNAKNKMKTKNPTLLETVKLVIQDVTRNENAKYSNISFSGGSYSTVIFVGDKVIKVGSTRYTKEIPSNPYIIKPLLRRELQDGKDSIFIEVTERVDTNNITEDDMYELYKKMRECGVRWTDIRRANVGRLRKDNVIHWNENLEPSDSSLNLTDKRGDVVLHKGDLVVLDGDYIYDVNDRDYCIGSDTYHEFEKKYQSEKRQNLSIESSKEVVDSLKNETHPSR